MIYNMEYESMPRGEMEQLQIERLQATLHRVYRNVSFYKSLYDKEGIDIDSVKSLEDLKKLPFTTKNDLRQSYPYEAFAVPLRDIVRIHSTSGTTGKPIVVGYTKNDLKTWSALVARILSAAGVTGHDFVQVAFDYSLSTGGFGFHYGAEKIGASVIPYSGADSGYEGLPHNHPGVHTRLRTACRFSYGRNGQGPPGIEPLYRSVRCRVLE